MKWRKNEEKCIKNQKKFKNELAKFWKQVYIIKSQVIPELKLKLKSDELMQKV